MMEKQWSRYQQAVFEQFATTSDDLIVDAVAGAGKTTTIEELARRIQTQYAAQGRSFSGLSLAFNKAAADTLNTRLAGTGFAGRTLHSVGNAALSQALGRAKIDSDKYKFLSWAWVKAHDVPEPLRFTKVSALVKLAHLVRCTLADPHDEAALVALCLHHDLDLDEWVLAEIAALIDEGNRLALEERKIDFDDMLYLVWKLAIHVPQVDVILVDEAQDLNNAQRALALKLRRPGGRMVFVGDGRQAIYGFTGASAESFQAIQLETGATLLPLSICYRCPSSVVALARQIVPQIEARPDAPLGLVAYDNPRDLHKLVREGDIILCRMTAPLITEALFLIKDKRPAKVRGRDIGKDLVVTLKKVAEIRGRDFQFEDLMECLLDYEEQQRAFLSKRKADESSYQILGDKIDCLQVIIEGFPQATCIDDLGREIDALFADEGQVIWLSTVHRAKGQEYDRVFILRPEKLPLVWEGQKPWQFVQEQNLTYVAITRALKELHIMGQFAPLIPPHEMSDDLDDDLDDDLSGIDPATMTDDQLARALEAVAALLEHTDENAHDSHQRVSSDPLSVKTQTASETLAPLPAREPDRVLTRAQRQIAPLSAPPPKPRYAPFVTGADSNGPNVLPHVVYTDEHPLIHPPGFRSPFPVHAPDAFAALREPKDSPDVDALVAWLERGLTPDALKALLAVAEDDPAVKSVIKALRSRS